MDKIIYSLVYNRKKSLNKKATPACSELQHDNFTTKGR